jgi:oligoribonuclease NrnB/cAMP/cGMP phosphodiesterase (DHH superfamily)
MIISITHEHDLDGLGSQAIIKRYFDLLNHEVEIRFLDANYSNFVDLVKFQLKSESLPTKLIISDLGFNKEFESLYNVFNIAKQKNCSILWFDHHVIDDFTKDKIRELVDVFINNNQKCAAEIVRDYFLPSDEIAKIVAEFARDTDFKTEKYKLASDIQLIIGYNIGVEGFMNRRKIVKLLSKGKFEDLWFERQREAIDGWFRKESNIALKKANIIDIENFGAICISFAKIGGGKITQILKKAFPDLKAYIGIDRRYNEIIIHSDFLNCRKFAMYFGGGGHEDRAGFKHEKVFSIKNNLSKKFLLDITTTLPKFCK